MQDSKKIKVFIIVASPLTQNILERIGYKEFGEVFDVWVVDCLYWLRNEAKAIHYQPGIADRVCPISSQAEFEELCESHQPNYLIDFTGGGSYTRIIQNIAASKKISYITHNITPLPSPPMLGGLKNRRLFETLKKLPSFIFRKLFARRRRPDIGLVAGDGGLNGWTTNARHIVWTASPDYFTYKKVREDEKRISRLAELGLKENGYIVFIDDCLARSFDFLLVGGGHIVEESEYLARLDRCFSQIEDALGIPVIIAAHPNGKEFSDYATIFSGRRVFFGKTALLSSGATHAITHFSCAVSFAVLFRKPVLFLGMRETDRSFQGASQEYMARILGRPIINVSDPLAHPFKVTDGFGGPVEEIKYANYMRRFITNTHPVGTNSFDSLINHITATG
ncbi:MAG: hypothetical protein RH862_14845 [Leptospiraceae bacterium]